jgi:xylulose-5-phosphate/fructose-6-phosphate phosphoketolase
MTVLNDLDRFHLVQDVINRVPKLGESGAALRKIMQHKLNEHKQYIEHYGEDRPEIRNWKWRSPA